MRKMKQAAREKATNGNRRKKDSNLLIVGIGASAGGLEALRELLGGLEHNERLTYVVVQHLSPSHTSMLRMLLSRECRLSVSELTASQVPQPDTIYITPPNWDIVIQDGVLRLVPLPTDVGPKPSINRFFSSLAEDKGKNAVGIILSGTGGDGASGLLAIKTHGGTTLVQEPESAKYDGMPKAAIQAGGAQMVLHPSKMGEALASVAITGALPSSAALSPDSSAYDKIIAYTKERLGFDLSLYKKSTVERRIKRRMTLKRMADMEDYLVYLQDHSEEVASFARDALISVTEFFRDTKAFEALNQILYELVTSYPLDRPLRIWVPGCATGEEAYTIAILLEEAMRRNDVQRKYQIFATDIDGGVAGKGRQGRYPASALKNVSLELRQRYFEHAGKEYVVGKAMREKIVFSVHNVTQDPPFSRVDLVSCRNLLIYFTPPLQKYVIELFYTALNPGGYLFLGKSEMVTDHADIFLPVAKSARLFKKVGDRRFLHSFNPLVEFRYKPPVIKHSQRTDETESVSSRLNETLSSEYAPPSVVITASDEVLHVAGQVQPYLRFPSGPIGLGIFDLAHERLRGELRALVYKCRREARPVSGGRHIIENEGQGLSTRCVVRPLRGEPYGLLVVSFEPVSEPPVLNDLAEPLNKDNLIIVELEHELATTREHLQTVVEELETSNEELQSVNEELQSSNEELQSTNEELQTANEELQSTNEELLTVNDELQIKSMELEKAATDLKNIQDSVDFPLIVIDKNMKVRSFVPACDQLLPLEEINEGDMFSVLPWRCEIPGLREAINQVLGKGKIFEARLDFGPRTYQFRALPYYSPVDGTIAGAILLFPDTTELLNAHLRIAQSEQRLKNLVSHIPDGIITADTTGRILSYSNAASLIFGYTPEEIEGRNLSVLVAQTVPDGEYTALGDCFLGGEARDGVQQIWGRRKNGTVFPLEFSTASMQLDGIKVFTIVVRDVAERVKGEEALFKEKERAQVTLRSIADAVITTDTEGRIEFMNPVAERLTGWSLDEACGEPINLVFRIIDEINREPLPNPVIAVLAGKDIRSKVTVAMRNRHHEEYAIEYSIAPILNKRDVTSGAVLVFHDVTDKQSMIRHIAWQARHDPLTRLVNRKEMEERLEHALTSAKSFQREHALLYIDLDQFKIVNDTCGHRAGDELLRQIADQMSLVIRQRDTLARLGGDEFGVLLENCALGQAQEIAEKIKDVVQEFRFAWDGKMFKVGASVGVAGITELSLNVAEILSDADAACYAAKDAGRNCVKVHNPDDAVLTHQRREMQWVTYIHQVLDDNRFKLYLQQICPLNGGLACHWEVLLRLEDDKGGLILPGAFLSAAERYGLMRNIDRWVLRSVLRHIYEFRKLNQRDFPMLAINLSAASLSDESFLYYVREQFDEWEIDASRICFEIIETAAITNFMRARSFISEMKLVGCCFALDDFGSGMSSFGYLKSLPVDFLKIDGSFVRGIAQNPIDHAMVDSINKIGHLMGIQTIAESAENKEVVDKLWHMGVDYAQGYALHRPTPMENFLEGLSSCSRE